MNRFEAVIEAVKNANYWMGGAVVVVNDGEYDAIPQALMNDASYTGSRDVIIDLTGGLETATGYSLDDGSAEEIAQLLIDNS